MSENIEVIQVGDRKIAVKGVGKMFYQEGFPLSLSISELRKKGIEVSMYHVIDELWNNGWSWKTIELKLTGEVQDDTEGLSFNMDNLIEFYLCLEQPYRKNGGYEKSREMIFDYVFADKEEALTFGRKMFV